MAWISLLIFITSALAADLPRFLTKHSPDTLRYISMDGRYAYVQKKPGVLGMVSSFRSVDFMSEPTASDFLVKSSRFRQRLIIETISNTHQDMSLVKNHKISVVDYGNTLIRQVGNGKAARLHLRDEWVTYYDIQQRIVLVMNLVTQKKFEIKLSAKANPFFVPEVEMVSGSGVVYTDINEAGYAALVSYDLQSLKSNILYKSSQNGTKIELCQHEDYLAMGEFPYDGVGRGSKIQTLPIREVTNLAGFSTVYNSVDQDIGNMVCTRDSIYFVKTFGVDPVLNHKVTDAVKLDLRTQTIAAKSDLKHVGQLIQMDGRVMIPLRGELFVLEGTANLGEDSLKSTPTKEELQVDL